MINDSSLTLLLAELSHTPCEGDQYNIINKICQYYKKMLFIIHLLNHSGFYALVVSECCIG